MRVALLRGVNVGGTTKVSMSDLRDALTRLGFKNARSLLNSGNLVFESNEAPAKLEALLEKRLGIEADVLVRTPQEIAEAVRRNPFTNEAKNDPGRLVVVFTKTPVDAAKLVISGPEIAKGKGREIFIYYPDGQGRSKLAIEKQLGTRVTARNWNTVIKLLEASQRDPRIAP